MLSVRKSVKRLTDRFLLPEKAAISGVNLARTFKPNPRGSLRALLTQMNQLADSARPTGGSTHPYYRRRMPDPQDVPIYQGDAYIDLRLVPFAASPGPLSFRKSVEGLTDRSLLPEEATISGIDLCRKFQPDPRGSLRALLTLLNQLADVVEAFDKRAAAAILGSAMPAIKASMGFAADGAPPPPDALPQAPPIVNDLNGALFDPPHDYSVLSLHLFPIFYTLASRSLAMMAYKDFFPNDKRTLKAAAPADDVPPVAPGYAGEQVGDYLRDLVNVGIMNASPGYCGVFGPLGLTGQLLGQEGNYDMTQTHLIPLAYSYYDELPDSREHLIRQLLAGGIVHRESVKDIKTSGPLPDDWTRAGYVSADDLVKAVGAAAAAAGAVLAAGGAAAAAGGTAAAASGAVAQALAAIADALAAVAGPIGAALGAIAGGLAGLIGPAVVAGDLKDIGETENHIISMLSTRYLTNQLLYQRNPVSDFDNRRNAAGGPTCMSLVLSELRNILRGDFSEYNAKSYQEETRWPILNLATYAYDHEVRLAARLALDYVSAHISVSSNDLRRIVPFRRRNEGTNVTQNNGHTAIGIVDWWFGADPLVPYFAIQTGNVRVYEAPNLTPLDPVHGDNRPVRPWPFGIAVDPHDVTKEALSSYRLPPLIQDLFVNDLHRRFFQRLHRTPQREAEGSRNCDNYELYASSPSYLITAGGQPAKYSLDPYFFGVLFPNQDQQKGVAMPTTFMPTGQSAGFGTQNSAENLIQFSNFSAEFDYEGKNIPEYLNYGVAPDFACGYGLYLPQWAKNKLQPSDVPQLHFINCGSDGHSPGFYLAIYQEGNYALLEALDTWLHPEVTFADFQGRVRAQSKGLNLRMSGTNTDQGGMYTTYHGTQILFDIWSDHTNLSIPDSKAGAYINNIVYSKVHPTDSQGDAGNVTGPFLNGTILNSPREAVVEISNPFYGPPGTKIILDLSDPAHPRRTSETGEVEQAGDNNEIWVNFGWTGPTEGDFFHPFNTLKSAVSAVADGGTIKIVPGWTTERPDFAGGKRYTIKAPIGGVRVGVR